jgi:hypothetical protein
MDQHVASLMRKLADVADVREKLAENLTSDGAIIPATNRGGPMRSERNLYDLAVARLRALFPTSRMVRELDAKLRAVPPPAKCSERACPFPPFKNGLCRSHAADAVAQYSVSSSMLGSKMIPQPRSPEPRSHHYAHA